SLHHIPHPRRRHLLRELSLEDPFAPRRDGRRVNVIAGLITYPHVVAIQRPTAAICLRREEIIHQSPALAAGTSPVQMRALNRTKIQEVNLVTVPDISPAFFHYSATHHIATLQRVMHHALLPDKLAAKLVEPIIR